MINWPETRILLLGAGLSAALSALLPACARADWPPPSYRAVYDLYMDGKVRGETRVRFDRDGQRWSFDNEAEGVKGLAGFLGAETAESSAGTLDGETILPERFSHRYKIAFRKDNWSAKFDWGEGVVRTTHKRDELELPLEPGTVDPLSLTLAMQLHLSRNAQEWETRFVDEDEIAAQRFRAVPAEPLPTPLGCLDVIEVQRIRENSTRYSSIWFAPDLDFITARMVHGKRDGHEFELKLRSLSVEGDAVKTENECTTEPES